MKDYEKAKIMWFVSFLNTDLSKLSLIDLMKLGTDTLAIIEGMSPYLFQSEYKKLMPSARWKDESPLREIINSDSWNQKDLHDKLKACQDRLKEYFDAGMEEVKTAKEWKLVPEEKNYIRFGQIQAEVMIRIETPICEPELKPDGDDLLARLSEKKLSQVSINIAYKAKDDETTLLIYFFQSLSILPINAFLKCPECNEYFVNFSKRKKMFCSHKCAARKSSKDRRERIKKDSTAHKAELKAGTERALYSYYKKRNKKHPNAPVNIRSKYKDLKIDIGKEDEE